ncbi:MAG TPA: restriction endonuclease [Verrucomicrobiae bacterium]|nr:restriction endonuclease [Verrucomicrobiae bacterium]
MKLVDIPPKPNNAASSLPISTRLQRLPLADLRWEDFERLCVRLVKKDPDAEYAQSYGVPGQNQEGIDLYVRKRSNGRYEVWQSKRYQKFGKSDVAKAVQKFLKAFKTGEAGIPIKDADILILAVTDDLSNTSIAKEIERQNKRLRRWFKITLVPCDIQGLSDKLKSHSDIVADFFGPVWVEEFCGIKYSSGIANELENAVVQTALRVAQEGLSSSGNDQLDRIRDLWGERHEDDALIELEKFKKLPTWPLLNADVQAKALRIEAGLRLQKNDAASARKLFDESKRIAPTANARVLEGKLIQHDQGAEAALAFLNQPKTDDERVFRWNLLLELGRPKEVTDEFSALPKQEIPAGDFSSVLALAQLAQLDISNADQTIRAALQKKPRHVTSRYVAAVVDYYWGISTTFRAWQHMIWPVPPPWNLVKRDEDSFERRRNAAQTFEELATTVLKTQASVLRVWQLACVALNSNDASQPSELARLCLAENPTNLPVLVWASAFRLEFDRASSIAVLRQRLDDNAGTLEDLLALLGLLDDVPDFVSYEKLITHHRSLFVNAGREQLWYLHQAQLLVEQGKSAEALQFIDSMPECKEGAHIKMVVQHLVAERSGRKEDYQLLLKAQEEDYQKSKTAENLLACCRTHRLLQQWDFIAQHAEELVHVVGTQSALEIAAEGLLQTRRVQECLDLLEKNRALCQRSELSPFLRRLAAEAHRLLGNLPGAILELERAAATETGVAAKMQLFQTQMQKGDLPAALQIARSLSLNPNVPAEFLVGQVIPVARHHDVELARELILKVESSSSGLSPQVEVKLMEEASRSGVETTFHKLVSKLMQQAVVGKGPLKAFTYEQTREMLLNRQKMASELWTAYARGEIPAHILASGLNLPLAKLLYEATRCNIKNRHPLQSQSVFTRYAGDANSQPCLLPTDVKEIFLDISSFLLLDALGLLSSVERAFDRLHIGSSLVQCLEEHLDQLSPQQPPRAFARQEIVKQLDASKLVIWQPATTPLPADSPLNPFVSDMGIEWCQRLSQVHIDAGLLIDFLPLHSVADINRGVLLPDSFAVLVISAQQLIHAMKRAGWITGVETANAVSAIGHNSSEGNDRIHLRAGMTIHLDSGQAEELALAGVLQTLCEKTQLTIEANDANRVRHEVSKEHADEELKKEIQRLLTHLSSAIGKAKYQVHVGKPFEHEEGKSPLQPPERALYEAIDFAEHGQIPVCIDDRLIRRHSTISKAPLCDTWDVLHHLQGCGAITGEVFRDARSRMRAANLRYLPVSTEEILSCVRSAPIQNGELQETPELACLRRYIAATLLDHQILQNSVRDQEGNVHPREAIWPARLQAAITKALADVWLNFSPANNHAQLQADWIWFNLCFDERLPAELFGHKLPDYDPADIVARQVGSLFGLGVGLYESATSSATVAARRKRYFQWLTERVVAPLLPNNPDLWGRAGKHIRRIFSFLTGDIQKLRLGEGKETINAQVIRHLIASYIADLPPELVNGLNLDSAELEMLGLIANSPGIEVLGLTFPAKDFWEAIARALKANHATLWVPDRKTKLRMKYDSKSNRILVSARGLTNSDWAGLGVPFLQLLSADPKQCAAVLRREATAFDLDEPRLSEVIQEISAIASASERVAKRTAYHEESPSVLYNELRQDIRNRKAVSINDLLPKQTDCLRRYLRLELGDKTLEDFAGRLMQRVGWVEAVVRLSRIPTNLPDAIINEWKQLTAGEQSSRLKELEVKLISPIERIHFLELLCHPATTATESLAQIKAQLNWLTDEKTGLAHGRAMLTVVRWVHLRLGWHAETSKWPAFARLCVVWSHGCALHRAFQTANASPDGIEKWFANNSQELVADRFILTNGQAHDAANPTDLRIRTLILKGVASACADLNDDQIRESSVQQKLPQIIGDKSFADHLDIWADRSLGGNLLGSYLSDLADEKLKRAVGDVAFDKHFRLQPRPITEHSLDELLKNPRDLESMFMLNCVVGDRPLYQDQRVKIPKVLAELDVVQFFKTSPDECGQFILFTSQLAASSIDTAQASKVWEECLRLAAHLAKTDPASEKEITLHQHLALSFTDAAIRLSSVSDDQKTGLHIFVAKLTDVAKRWPGFAKHYGSTLTQALNRLPADKLIGFPELITILRACI